MRCFYSCTYTGFKTSNGNLRGIIVLSPSCGGGFFKDTYYISEMAFPFSGSSVEREDETERG